MIPEWNNYNDPFLKFINSLKLILLFAIFLFLVISTKFNKVYLNMIAS